MTETSLDLRMSDTVKWLKEGFLDNWMVGKEGDRRGRHADLGLSLGVDVTDVSCYSRCALDIV